MMELNRKSMTYNLIFFLKLLIIVLAYTFMSCAMDNPPLLTSDEDYILIYDEDDLTTSNEKSLALPQSIQPTMQSWEILHNENDPTQASIRYGDNTKAPQHETLFTRMLQGAKFSSETSDPIHYYIVINPKKPINGVVFFVYGGGTKNGPLDALKDALVADGIVVVTLNFIDIKARESGELGNQDYYPPALLKRVMNCIQVARSKIPNIIQNALSSLSVNQSLNQAKYFIMGSSMGGSLTQLVATDPSTHSLFDGYISHAGTPNIILDTQSKSQGALERSLDTGGWSPNFDFSHLDVLKQAANLSKPLLLIHGLKDTNVHAMNSIILAKALGGLGKSDLVNLDIYTDFDHGYPKDPSDFSLFVSSIVQFIDNPRMKSGPMAEALWNNRADRFHQKASITFGLGNLMDMANIENQFMSKSLTTFQETFKNAQGIDKINHIKSVKNKNLWNDEWTLMFRPLLEDTLLDNIFVGSFQDFYFSAFKSISVHAQFNENATGYQLILLTKLPTEEADLKPNILYLKKARTALAYVVLDQNGKMAGGKIDIDVPDNINDEELNQTYKSQILEKTAAKGHTPVKQYLSIFSMPIYKWFLDLVNHNLTPCTAGSESYELNHPYCHSLILKKLSPLGAIKLGETNLFSEISKVSDDDLSQNCASLLFGKIFLKHKIPIQLNYCRFAFVDWVVTFFSNTLTEKMIEPIKAQKAVTGIIQLALQENYLEAITQMREFIKKSDSFKKRILVLENQYIPVLKAKILSTLKMTFLPIKIFAQQAKNQQNQQTTETQPQRQKDIMEEKEIGQDNLLGQ